MRALIAAALLAGCGVPGTCDDAAARRVATRFDGFPAYEGQALLIRSCGYGSHCHSEAIPSDERYGAPVGLELDVRLASQGPEPGDVDRLDRNQRRVYEMRGEIWQQIASGAMPPGGADAEVIAASAPVYFRLDTGELVPGLETDEGREIVRNWLACGTPVIERTQPRADGVPSVIGDTVIRSCTAPEDCDVVATPRCDLSMNACVPCESDADCGHLAPATLCDLGECVEPAEPAFSSIFELVFRRRCSTAACHSDERRAGRLSLETVEGAHAELVGVPADGSVFCRLESIDRVVPSDPEASLLYQKVVLAIDTCGEHMPLGQEAVPAQHAEAIRAWIAAGASLD